MEEDGSSDHPLFQDSLMQSDTEQYESDCESYETESDGDSDESVSHKHKKQRKSSDNDFVPIPSTSRAVSPVNVSSGRERGTPGACVRGCGRGTPKSVLIRKWENARSWAPNEHIEFLGKPGIQRSIENFTPVDFLQLFIDEDLLNYIVNQTNLYAQAYIDKNPNLARHSRVRCWEPVTHIEMKQFLGLVFLMGLIKLPSTELYWSTKNLYRCPAFAAVMTRNRFMTILRFLHFHDNSQMPDRSDPNYDRLYKIRPVADHLHEKFQAMYEPRQAVCVNESLLFWKGKLFFRRYTSLKMDRCGIKLYQCCESENGEKGNGGYCYRFKVYTGKKNPVDDIQPFLPADAQELSTREKMVVFLIAPFLGKGYTVYTDKWCTSLQLFLYLLQKQTLACGTVQVDKGVPTELEAVQLSPGASHAVCGDQKVVATKYHSTEVVHFLSTAHGHKEHSVVDRRQRRPDVSKTYHKNMAGVDKMHQLLQPYDCTRKSMKWTKQLFFHFLQMAACNGFILACKTGYSQKFRNFLESAIISWLWPDTEPPACILDKKVDEARLKERHFSYPIPSRETRTYPQKPCKVCKKKLGVRKDTRYYCPSCPSKPGLCYPDCFVDYHTKFVYWK